MAPPPPRVADVSLQKATAGGARTAGDVVEHARALSLSDVGDVTDAFMAYPAAMEAPEPPEPAPRDGRDPVTAILARQAASGLWEEPGGDPLRDTVDALVALYRAGVTASHPVHGAQLKKAVGALLAFIDASAADASLVELALAIAWLVSSGRRTKKAIEDATRERGRDLAALAGSLGDEAAVRDRVDRLAPAMG
jgi:Ca-activated chloride channel family protein